MKKFSLALAALFVLVLASNSNAQGLYAQFRAGYAMSTASSVIGTDMTTTTSGFTTKNIYGNAGQGLNAAVAFGYMINENIGIELNTMYFAGSKVKYDLDATPIGESTSTIQSSQIRIAPSIVLTTGGEGLAPYARFGLLLPVTGQTVAITEGEDLEENDFTKSQTTRYSKSETTGSLSVGFNSAFGLNFSISENLSLFGELEVVTLSIKSSKTTLTDYKVENTTTVKATDTAITTTFELKDLDTINKEIEYLDEITDKSNTGDDVDKPRQTLASKANYNSLGLNIGVKFKF